MLHRVLSKQRHPGDNASQCQRVSQNHRMSRVNAAASNNQQRSERRSPWIAPRINSFFKTLGLELCFAVRSLAKSLDPT